MEATLRGQLAKGSPALGRAGGGGGKGKMLTNKSDLAFLQFLQIIDALILFLLCLDISLLLKLITKSLILSLSTKFLYILSNT